MQVKLNILGAAISGEVRDEPFTMEEIRQLYPQWSERTIREYLVHDEGGVCETEGLYGAIPVAVDVHDTSYPCQLWDTDETVYSSGGNEVNRYSGWVLVFYDTYSKRFSLRWTVGFGRASVENVLLAYEDVAPLLTGKPHEGAKPKYPGWIKERVA